MSPPLHRAHPSCLYPHLSQACSSLFAHSNSTHLTLHICSLESGPRRAVSVSR
jgi:hypothetical protein